MKKAASRPHVICHMFSSIDGRIVVTRWGIGSMATKAYERTAATLRRDFIAGHDAESYAIAIDPSGKLTWRSNDIDGEHVITILTET